MSSLREMIATIRAEAEYAAPWTGSATISESVLEAMTAVPRHEFVPAGLRHSAYGDAPLPIGHGQTISQPYIVALMTDLLRLAPGDTVLDVGTGSGYQAAVLARLVARVYSVENVAALARAARQRLKRLGCANVEVHWGNGFNGLPEHAPYDAILVAAAPERIPDALLQQLAPGGRLVLPLGGRDRSQELTLVSKDAAGELSTKGVLPVAFVPLVDRLQSDAQDVV